LGEKVDWGKIWSWGGANKKIKKEGGGGKGMGTTSIQRSGKNIFTQKIVWEVGGVIGRLGHTSGKN